MNFFSWQYASDENGSVPVDTVTTLQEHDNRFHKGGFHEGSSCSFRDKHPEIVNEQRRRDDVDAMSVGQKEDNENPPNLNSAPSDPEEFNRWFVSHENRVYDDIMEWGGFDESYDGMVRRAIERIREDPYNSVSGETYEDILKELVSGIVANEQQYRADQEDYDSEMKAEIAMGK